MSNRFTRDILLQAPNPEEAARFYVETLGFVVTDRSPEMLSLHGDGINFFIERGPVLGPVLEVKVANLEKAKAAVVRAGGVVIKDEPEFPRCYVRDPYGLIYNLAE
jgi:catechol 2,3-dioxygenase-like lactoylglutathione lyase family enzyme